MTNSDFSSCLDNSCIFGHPGGQRTNGGCAHLKLNHIETRRLLKQLAREYLRVKSINSAAVSNLSLYRCPSCKHLSRQGWTCPECGKDPTEALKEQEKTE